MTLATAPRPTKTSNPRGTFRTLAAVMTHGSITSMIFGLAAFTALLAQPQDSKVPAFTKAATGTIEAPALKPVRLVAAKSEIEAPVPVRAERPTPAPVQTDPDETDILASPYTPYSGEGCGDTRFRYSPAANTILDTTTLKYPKGMTSGYWGVAEIVAKCWGYDGSETGHAQLQKAIETALKENNGKKSTALSGGEDVTLPNRFQQGWIIADWKSGVTPAKKPAEKLAGSKAPSKKAAAKPKKRPQAEQASLTPSQIMTKSFTP